MPNAEGRMEEHNDASQRFEAMAESFERATGYPAIGKDVAAEAHGGDMWQRQRTELWHVFRAGHAHALAARTREVEEMRAAGVTMSRAADRHLATATANYERAERYEKAIRWALGEDGEFAMWDGYDEGRRPADGLTPRVGYFWWRTELRQRAALGRALAAQEGTR